MSVVSNLLMDANAEAWIATAEEVNIGEIHVHVQFLQLIKYQQYKCSRCVLCIKLYLNQCLWVCILSCDQDLNDKEHTSMV